jgi:hypothetical protein
MELVNFKGKHQRLHIQIRTLTTLLPLKVDVPYTLCFFTD